MMTPTADLPVPSLLYGETEEELRHTVRRMLDEISPWTAVVEALDGELVHDDKLWQQLHAAGLTGLLVPEGLGGGGATARELAVVLEEIGRAAAPVPLLASGVIATVSLLQISTAADAWLRRLAVDGSIGAVTVPASGRCDTPPSPAFRADVSAAGTCTVSGRVDGVIGAERADFLIVPALGVEGPVLAVVDPVPAGSVQVGCSLDMTRPLATIDLNRVSASVVARDRDATTALKNGLLAGTAMLASEQLGVAERALDLACEHLRARRQFGRQLGTYQSLRHRAAQLWTDITSARAVARYAAGCCAEGLADSELAAHLAQAVCADVALDAAEACLQIMGGIGFTWDNPTHLVLKRAVASHSLLGSPERHRDRVAELRGFAEVVIG